MPAAVSMKLVHIIRCVLAASLLASCTATCSPATLKDIQDTRGLYTKSLHYIGSSSKFHYFEQDVLFGRSGWLPWAEPFHEDAYRVSRKELILPAGLFFSHSTYTGEKDSRRAKVRVTGGPPYQVERRVHSKHTQSEVSQRLRDHDASID